MSSQCIKYVIWYPVHGIIIYCTVAVKAANGDACSLTVLRPIWLKSCVWTTAGVSMLTSKYYCVYTIYCIMGQALLRLYPTDTERDECYFRWLLLFAHVTKV